MTELILELVVALFVFCLHLGALLFCVFRRDWWGIAIFLSLVLASLLWVIMAYDRRDKGVPL